MESGAYRPSRHQQLMGWGVGLVAAGICLCVALFVLLIIGAFDQWHIQSDAQLSFVFSVPVLMVFVGLALFVVGVVNAFRARR
ncbi:hypothetical protein IMT09_04015 [Burkholderia cepacia]|uniref:hypothetical protein n=1 Tax=Burkholderia cepacia TaxID=292 RepID=UPI00075AD525|nr:hypothetical protein [Burkholderia cepacia]KVW08319.1 hypothetical protein WK91_29660 [Burkholderia cepacia]KWB12790.1 hypothetical protein WL32_35795 [Burkholderia cepacia]KWB30586.1 hypothetical protein WL34_30455 [Burkholderia cepacia]MBE2967277.1 hypothetical protein [Burkholderia cepacia]MCA8320184.1 hypothetical protein [Burkholderia cepacia]